MSENSLATVGLQLYFFFNLIWMFGRVRLTKASQMEEKLDQRKLAASLVLGIDIRSQYTKLIFEKKIEMINFREKE